MEVEHAARHWREGRSASQIVDSIFAEFGIERSRNSVIGKLNHIGLMGTRPKRVTHRRRVSDLIADARELFGKFGEPRPLPPDEPIPSTAVTLDDRSTDQCVWPVNHGAPEFLFCGAPKEPGEDFCTHHASRAYRRPEKCAHA